MLQPFCFASPVPPPFWKDTINPTLHFYHWSANLPTLLVQESYARILEERKHAQHPPGDALRPTSSTQKSSKASSKIVALDALEGEVQELVR